SNHSRRLTSPLGSRGRRGPSLNAAGTAPARGLPRPHRSPTASLPAAVERAEPLWYDGGSVSRARLPASRKRVPDERGPLPAEGVDVTTRALLKKLTRLEGRAGVPP